MAEGMKRIILVTGSDAERTLNAAARLCQVLWQYGITILAEEKDWSWLEMVGPGRAEYFLWGDWKRLKGCDCVITVGGDGTVLRGAEASLAVGCPLAGVNTGNVGFLARIPDSLPQILIEKIVKGKLPKIRQMTLQASWQNGRIPGALNDITLTRLPEGRMCTFHVYCDEERLGVWRADGIVLFTPSGSTAYAYAAGGPAVDPRTNLIGIIPLCAQSGRTNGLICSCERQIMVISNGERVGVSVDGRLAGYLEPNEPIKIMQGEKSVMFLDIDGEWRIEKLNRRLMEL